MKKKGTGGKMEEDAAQREKGGGGGKADLAVTGALGEILAASLFLVSLLL
jgi:hypothetical protein